MVDAIRKHCSLLRLSGLPASAAQHTPTRRAVPRRTYGVLAIAQRHPHIFQRLASRCCVAGDRRSVAAVLDQRRPPFAPSRLDETPAR